MLVYAFSHRGLYDFEVTMRSNGCYGQKKWLARGNGIIKETISLVRNDVCRIFSVMADRRLSISLSCGV